MGKKKNKYYVVWSGHHPGVYDSWEKCQREIKGFTNAIFKGFPTRDSAEKAINLPASDYIGKDVRRDAMTDEQRQKVGLPIETTLSVDAACAGNPGVLEYRGVYTATGQEIFRKGPFKQGTVNIGEFLALVHGLAYLKQQGSTMDVYSDSRTAMSWVRNKKVNTKLASTPENQVLFDMVERALTWLHNNTYTNKIMKWETKYWGEIPADFGRK